VNYIYINKLVLKGISKDYKVEFKKSLNIIAGPITTGKSTIFHIIDYCFGKHTHPKYIEIRKVSIALLEITIDDEVFTIERQLFAENKKITIHYVAIDDLNKVHHKIEVYPTQKKTQESISSFILKKLNLWGIQLKESLSKSASGVDIMSFRDILWFCYLNQNRIDDDKHFLFENEYYKNIKFKQVFKVLFNIQDNKEASLAEQLKEKKHEKTEIKNKIDVLHEFLKSSHVSNKEDLVKMKKELELKIDNANKKYSALTEEHQELISFSDDIRNELIDLDGKIRQEKNDLREKIVLKEKMMTLLGQYEEDIWGIKALIEAKRLIDPLNIVRCPVCLELIGDAPIKDNCKLCKNELPKLESSEFENPTTELTRLKRKYNEILTVIDDLENEISDLKHNLTIDELDFSKKSIELENRIKSLISPITMLREQSYSKIQEIKLKIKNVEEKLGYYGILEEYQKEFGKIIKQIEELDKNIKMLKKKIIKPYEEILKDFSKCFYETLSILKFPKLDKNVKIDDDLTPYVRDTDYRSFGSLGAIVIITQAWYIALFKILSKYESTHPDFFLVDSPQSNIGLNTKEEDYKDIEIVKCIYNEYKKLIDNNIIEQLIIVDNAPPPGYEEFICIKFTRDPKISPYGLIDDEISEPEEQ